MWARADDDDTWSIDRFEGGHTMMAAARLHEGLIAVGRTDTGSQPMVVLTSSDGTDWRQAPHRPAYGTDFVHALVLHGPDQIVGVGDAVFVGPGRAADYAP